MNSTPLRQEFLLLIRLALPVFLAQISMVSMGFVDTVVAGKASAVDMAGVAVASSFWFPITLFGQGLLMSITPLVAQSVGAGNSQGLGVFFRQGLWLASFICLCIIGVIVGISVALPSMRSMDPELARITCGYLQAIVWGAPGLMLFCVQRSFLEGHGRTRPAMVAGFLGLILNIPLNYIFVFGKFGMPALGGIGCGVASAVVCWIMAGVLFFSVRRVAPRAWRWEAFQAKVGMRLLRISTPNAFAMLIETSAFALIALVITPLGPLIVAGHQVAMNVSALVFMLPLSLGAATTIRIGTLLGQGKLPRAHTVRKIALVTSLGIVACVGGLIYLFRHAIVGIYTTDVQVLGLASGLLIYNAIYLCSDAVQVVSIGALRGYNDTRSIFIISLLSYWGVCFPLGYALGMTDLFTSKPFGVEGFWMAFIVGLTVAAGLFLWRIGTMEKLDLAAVKAKINR